MLQLGLGFLQEIGFKLIEVTFGKFRGDIIPPLIFLLSLILCSFIEFSNRFVVLSFQIFKKFIRDILVNWIIVHIL